MTTRYFLNAFDLPPSRGPAAVNVGFEGALCGLYV